MARVKLSPPWDIFYREINAMFAKDSEVKVVYDEQALLIKLYVANPKKANALQKLIPSKKDFGNVTLNIEVVPPNGVFTNTNDITTIKDALDGNGALSNIIEIDGVFVFRAIYVLFKKEVVQFYTDNLGDYNGMKSTLYEDIAKDIFETPVADNVCFCTDINDPNTCLKTLGEPITTTTTASGYIVEY